jgi:predicted transcriptional regulator
MAKYRTKLQIIAEILEIVRGGAKKTHIMYRANLSYKLLCKYLDEVLACELVEVDSDDSYAVAPKGLEFLRKFAAYRKLRARVKDEVAKVNEKKRVLEQTYTNAEARSVGKNLSAAKST